MDRFIIDLDGKSIKVTDIDGAIAQVSCYTKFSSTPNLNVGAYWKDTLKKLKALKKEIEAEPVPVKVVDEIADSLPLWVKEMREKRITSYQSGLKYNTPDGHKLFSKDKKDSPLFGAHSCVRTDTNLRKLDQLEIGETWERFGQPNITRIF
jgi:hypothetical protein